MSNNSFTIATFLPASPERIYRDWLSSDGHTLMTGSPAKVEPGIGGEFTAWEDYISGKTLVMEPGRRILQAWRTTEFPEESPDSQVEVILEAEGGGTRLTLVHTQIPEGQSDDYLQGWKDFYFTPMAEYYSKKLEE